MKPELVGEKISVRSRVLVDKTHLWSYMRIGFDAGSEIVSHHGSQSRFAPQSFDDHRTHISTTIPTIIDDQGFLVQLRIKITRKLIQTDRKSTRLNSSHVAISYA